MKKKGNEMELLNKIQQELKAPKNQTNNFGKYKYRSCEDILEAVKPLLGKGTLTLSDKVLECGGRVFIEAMAVLKDENGGTEAVTASAREPEEQKGMSASQITGSASSYARKYALNGLFCIDDTKDADTQDNRTQKPAAKPKAKPKADDDPDFIKNDPPPIKDKPSVATKFKALKKMDDTETACMTEVMLGTTTLQPKDISMGDWKRQRAIDIFGKFERWPLDSDDVTACIELIQRMYHRK